MDGEDSEGGFREGPFVVCGLDYDADMLRGFNSFTVRGKLKEVDEGYG